jgi:hypothetical protein
MISACSIANAIIAFNQWIPYPSMLSCCYRRSAIRATLQITEDLTMSDKVQATETHQPHKTTTKQAPPAVQHKAPASGTTQLIAEEVLPPVQVQSLNPQQMMSLQHSVGNQAVNQLLATRPLQPQSVATPSISRQPATTAPVIRRMINQKYANWQPPAEVTADPQPSTADPQPSKENEPGIKTTKTLIKQYYRDVVAPDLRKLEDKWEERATRKKPVGTRSAEEEAVIAAARLFHGALAMDGTDLQKELPTLVDDLVDKINAAWRQTARQELAEGLQERDPAKVNWATKHYPEVVNAISGSVDPLLQAEGGLLSAPPDKQEQSQEILDNLHATTLATSTPPAHSHKSDQIPEQLALPCQLTPELRQLLSVGLYRDMLHIVARISDYNWRLTKADPGSEALLARLDQIEEKIEAVLHTYEKEFAKLPDQFYTGLDHTLKMLTTQRTYLNTQLRAAFNLPPAVGAGNRMDLHKQLDKLTPQTVIKDAEQAKLQAIYARQLADMGQVEKRTESGTLEKVEHAKTQEEAWSAVAAAQDLPDLFSKIEPARKGKNFPDPLARETGTSKSSLNVEYYDNEGNPWDQKGAFYGGGEKVFEAMKKVASAIQHQQAFHYPHKDATEGQIESKPQDAFKAVGVLLDVTYLDDQQYQALWSKIFQNPEIALDRLREVRVKAIEKAPPGLTLKPDKIATGQDGNVYQLELWSKPSATPKVRDKEAERPKKKWKPKKTETPAMPQAPEPETPPKIPEIRYEVIEKHCNREELRKIFAGVAESWSLFRNHRGLLPGGTRYTEHSVASIDLKDKNSVRFVYSTGQHKLYITGTHYEPWFDGTSARPAFYEITGLPDKK